jgi:hypothetical protein
MPERFAAPGVSEQDQPTTHGLNGRKARAVKDPALRGIELELERTLGMVQYAYGPQRGSHCSSPTSRLPLQCPNTLKPKLKKTLENYAVRQLPDGPLQGALLFFSTRVGFLRGTVL